MRVGITAFLTDLAMPPAELARAAEERGFYSLYLPEHTHLPVRAATPPALVEGVGLDDYRRSLDPFVALAMAAAVTVRLRLGTGVTLVAEHDPIVLAKQVATLDHLSGGRVVLAVWDQPELNPWATLADRAMSELGYATRHDPNGISASAAPPIAQNATTSHGGVFHMKSKRNAATPSAKSPALVMPDVHTGL